MTRSHRDIKKLILKYHAFSFFFSLLFWAPIFYEFQRRMGLNDAQIFGIQSLYYLAFCFLEVPTGFISDRYGHRTGLRWAAFFLTVANLIPCFITTFSAFLLHWLLVALARSLVSGSASAYLYDFLEELGEADWYRDTEGKARAYSLVGRVAAWSVVGYLMEWHLTLPYWLTAGAALIALAISWTLPPNQGLKERPTLSGCWQVLRHTPKLWWAMGSGLSIFVLARLVQVNLFNPILLASGYTVASFGVVMAVTTLFEAFGSAQGDRMAKQVGTTRSVLLLGLVVGVTTAFFPLTGRLGTFLLLSVFAVAVGLAYPVQRELLNQTIPRAELRASLMSIESLLDRLACSGMAAAAGVFASHGHVDFLLYGFGGITLIVTAWLGRLLKRL